MLDAVLLPPPDSIAPYVPVPPSPKTRPKQARAIVQAVKLQAIVFGAVSPTLKPGEIAGLARAWCDLNEERRKLAMQPLPRPIDTTKFQRKGRRQAVAVEEPSEPSAPVKAADLTPKPG